MSLDRNLEIYSYLTPTAGSGLRRVRDLSKVERLDTHDPLPQLRP